MKPRKFPAEAPAEPEIHWIFVGSRVPIQMRPPKKGGIRKAWYCLMLAQSGEMVS
jgi:hypothetical protein